MPRRSWPGRRRRAPSALRTRPVLPLPCAASSRSRGAPATSSGRAPCSACRPRRAGADPDAWAMAALTGALDAAGLPAPDEAWDDARLHAWWRSQHSLTPARLARAKVLNRARRDTVPDGRGRAAKGLLLDADDPPRPVAQVRRKRRSSGDGVVFSSSFYDAGAASWPDTGRRPSQRLSAAHAGQYPAMGAGARRSPRKPAPRVLALLWRGGLTPASEHVADTGGGRRGLRSAIHRSAPRALGSRGTGQAAAWPRSRWTKGSCWRCDCPTVPRGRSCWRTGPPARPGITPVRFRRRSCGPWPRSGPEVRADRL